VTRVFLVDIDDDGTVVDAGKQFASDAPRALPRVAVDGTGAFAAWADRASVAEVSAAATSPATTPFVGATGGGLALLASGGTQTVAWTDGDGLELNNGSATRYLAGNVSGPVDAVSCGGNLTVAFRGVNDDKLLVADVSTAKATYLPDAFDGLPGGRAPGDVAISCDQGRLWIAHVVQGAGALRVASFDGTAWNAAAADIDAEGAVSLAVEAGAFHAAFAGADGRVRYAASR
jgi:hypothetical protein